jgi:hypothetical protein
VISSADELVWISESSLGLSSIGEAFVSFYHATDGDLKLAHLSAPPDLCLGWSVAGVEFHLVWNQIPNAVWYWIYGASNEWHFIPGVLPDHEHRLAVVAQGTTNWVSPYPVGDPESNWAYLVIAVDELESELTRSNRVGELDYDADIP